MQKKTINPIYLFLIASMLFSCQRESINNLGIDSELLSISEARSFEDCSTCVDAWEDTEETISYGEFGLSLVAEQDADGITYLHLLRSGGSFTKLSYKVDFTDVSSSTTTNLLTQADPSAAGGSTSDRDLLKNKTGTVNLSIADFPTGWEACDYVSVTFTAVDGVGFGTHAPITVKYYLHELCEEECEESFSYNTADNLSVVFTYISPVHLDNAEVKLTCPHIISYTANDGKTYTVNPGNGHGSPTVLTWEGDIKACVPITFDLTFSPDCTQNQAGFANIWTDFKVNDTSKKNDDTPNVRFSCPE